MCENISFSILCSKIPTNFQPRVVLTPKKAGVTCKNSTDNIFDSHNESGDNVAVIEQHSGTDNPNVNKDTSNASNKNFIKKCDSEGDDLNQAPFTFSPYFWTLFAGFVCCFLGGLWVIQGHPIIIHFLHPTYPISLQNKKLQRANDAAISLTNVTMRFIYYLINIFELNKTSFFATSEWGIYAFTHIYSQWAVSWIVQSFLILSRATKISSGVNWEYL